MLNICPISNNTIDEKIVRIMSFLTLILVILGYFLSYWIFLFIAIDFLLRIFYKNFSPLKKVSQLIVKILKIKMRKLIDAAPKKFSAWVGFIFSKIIFWLLFFNFIFIAKTFIIIFLIAVSLETFFNYCLGCKIYSFLQSLKK